MTTSDGTHSLDRPLAAAQTQHGAGIPLGDYCADTDRRQSGSPVDKSKKSRTGMDKGNDVLDRPLTVARPRHTGNRASRDWDSGNDDSGMSDEDETNTLMVKVVLPRERTHSSKE
jgi:hypothetical protein